MAAGPANGLIPQWGAQPKPLLIDTCVWIEYFNSTSRGARAAEIIDVDDPSQPRFVHSLCLLELRRAYKARDEDFDRDLPFLRGRARILEDVTLECAITAGRLKNAVEPYVKRRLKNGDLSTVDCLLLAVALINEFRVVSGDRAFDVLSKPDARGLSSEGLEITLPGSERKHISDYVYYLP